MDKPELTPSEVQAFIKADKEAREQRTRQRIEQVLAEERCRILPIVILAAGNITSRIEIKAQD